MQEEKPGKLVDRTVDPAAFGRSALAAISQRTAASVRGGRHPSLLAAEHWLMAAETLRAKRGESGGLRPQAQDRDEGAEGVAGLAALRLAACSG